MNQAAFKSKLNNFPKIQHKDPKNLYDLLDSLPEIESVKENPQYATLLSYYDSPSGVNPIINHCRTNGYQQSTKSTKYYSVPFPPFSFLVDFINEKRSCISQFDRLILSTASSAKRTTEHKRATGSLFTFA